MKIKNRARNYQDRKSMNVTPLIDVIFLLMIFFLMTINFNKTEGVLENQLPRVSGQESSEDPQDYEKVRLRVKMLRDNNQMKIYLQERIVFTYDDLLYYLDQLPRDILIIIEPANKVPYKHVIGVYNTCIKSKKENIVFSISS